jgi:hypothetical protein
MIVCLIVIAVLLMILIAVFIIYMDYVTDIWDEILEVQKDIYADIDIYMCRRE